MKRRLIDTSLVFLSMAIASFASELTLQYSFVGTLSGGLAQIELDSKSGKITGQKILFESKHCRFPKKVRPVKDGRTVLLTNDSKDQPYLFIIDTINTRQSRIVEMKSQPDEVRISGAQAIVTCGDDWIATVDINSRTILGSWDSSNLTRIKWNGPEDIFVTPDNEHAIISFQKDSKKGKRKGGRLIVFQLPGMRLVSDVALARDYEKWVLKNRIRKLGPGPELIFLDQKNDTILSTLDNYGAVVFLKWSELKTGKLSEFKYLPTSRDYSWGTSFPDRGSLFQLDGKSTALIMNAGTEGGAVLLDVAARNVVHYFEVPSGLEVPHFVPQLNRAFAVCPGKTKERRADTVIKTYEPKKALFVFELGGKPTVKEIERRRYLFQLQPVPRVNQLPLMVISAGETSKRADTLLVFDPQTMKFVDQKRALGKIGQFAHQ